MKYKIKQFLNRHNKKILTIALSLFVLFVSLGYATLQEHMDIDGIATIDRSWIIKITGAYCTPTGSAKATSTSSISNTYTLHAYVPPGSTLTCTVAVLNQGNVNAKFVSTDVISENGEAVPYTISGVNEGAKLAINGSAIFTIKLVPRTSFEADYNVTYMFTFNFVEDAPTSGSNDKGSSSFNTGGYETFLAGEIVQTLDNNVWYVTKNTGAAEEYVTLVSMMPLTSTGDFAKCGFGAYECGDKRAFDTSGSSDYNQFSSTNVGYFLENTFLPKIKTSLTNAKGDINGLSTRLLTSEEVKYIDTYIKTHGAATVLERMNGTSLSNYSRWFMDKSDTDNSKVKCSQGYNAYTLWSSSWNESTSVSSITGGGTKICSPTETKSVVPVIVTKKSNVYRTIVNVIYRDNVPSSANNLNYKNISSSSNGQGLYIGESVSFFRGAVTNNYVSFAGKTWRIIGIYSDGVKLILEGADSLNSPFNTAFYTGNTPHLAQLGYMYAKSGDMGRDYSTVFANQLPSSVKAKLDSWYTTNLNKYTAYITDGNGFCNERTLINNGTNYSVGSTFSAYTRLGQNSSPLRTCQTSDLFTVSISGNKALTSPIGLISADEVVYAGGVYNLTGTAVVNTSYYLYSGGDSFTMTPAGSIKSSNNHAVVFTINGWANAETSKTIRPVIYLKDTDIVQAGGNGTKAKPYVIKT